MAGKWAITRINLHIELTSSSYALSCEGANQTNAYCRFDPGESPILPGLSLAPGPVGACADTEQPCARGCRRHMPIHGSHANHPVDVAGAGTIDCGRSDTP